MLCYIGCLNLKREFVKLWSLWEKFLCRQGLWLFLKPRHEEVSLWWIFSRWNEWYVLLPLFWGEKEERGTGETHLTVKESFDKLFNHESGPAAGSIFYVEAKKVALRFFLLPHFISSHFRSLTFKKIYLDIVHVSRLVRMRLGLPSLYYSAYTLHFLFFLGFVQRFSQKTNIASSTFSANSSQVSIFLFWLHRLG